MGKADHARRWALLSVSFALAASGCAEHQMDVTKEAAPGFLYGLLHGFLIFFSFIASFFTDYKIYAVPNNGWPYDLGFVLGASFFLGGSGSASR